ncbi:hypothetical protein HKK58_02450 [Pseudomonas sp. ADAK22]|uniref:hypothetical protein n=1 Tax=Pseudomonas sp. ADAK22 TaxID=2730851 RepID=UPI001464315D|nr:hypothetical protein [Pseudomonas sp. ADAK22]QJI11431.1 hypothetical protein HKK58_02450 [Pseudomonas sp. ADAK22]
MKSALIKEIGIHPWDQVHPSNDENYITVTLLNQEYAGAWESWCKLVPLLAPKWPKIVQWHTRSLPFYSKSQEYISQKKFEKTSNPGDIFRKNQSTTVYSQIINLNSDPFQIDHNCMSVYRTSITLMLKDNSNLERLWYKLSRLTDISTTDDFRLILSNENTISFRFYDAETHGVAQLICHSEHLPFLNEAIKKLDLEEIQQKNVYEYIHR